MLQGSEILTTAQMRAIESAAMASGRVTGAALMERAGAAVAGQIRLRWPKLGRAVVLCGPGNNGGDGYVIARHLQRAGWQLRVLGMDNAPGPDAARMKAEWLALGSILPLTEDNLRAGPGADVYVDAIFGTGLTRAPEGEIAAILAHLGGSGGDWAFFRERLVAVDCPSGLCLDSGAFPGRPRRSGDHDLRARLTVAFESPKPGHLLERGPECCGELVIADIGLGPWRVRNLNEDGTPSRGIRYATIQAIWPDFAIADSRRDPIMDGKRARWLRKQDGGDHKFSHGHALILAGGVARGGAARLSARAALRAGAGLVTLAPPAEALPEHAGPPDALMRWAIDDPAELRDMLEDRRINALCIGPGCGIERAAALLPAILATKRGVVLDADALTALSTDPDLMALLHEDCVLTPHAGEFARVFPDLAARLEHPRPPELTRDAAATDWTRMGRHLMETEAYHEELAQMRGPLYSRLDAARDAAKRCGALVLLKGPDTVIAAPNGQARIHSAFDIPWLATAGAGDVLAGIIAGLLARGLPALDAAGTGAWLHAQAARQVGPGLIADDLPEALPAVLRGLQA
ncbi:yjeF N-terminal region [Paracoccus aminovorans]|uniref:Bifunctional NAD(P)H-hydrate repair enzyme n=1 Tax=Paracoccus aminovorans TaxID=34004 RepID=A0A1I2XFW0_9RHOB|nr:NAD(P)H-hydrate epimerase [Paracoccus aminovorans]CQR85728.1 hypothetical protein JCM7685_1151 [Paracoccus aminovorans]SFH12373.1 yjeF N-terminal region [Paracoccus aminovorans]